jgi:hypothetical protein
MKRPDECDLGNISESQKLPNVFTGARRTVTKLSSLLALSHVFFRYAWCLYQNSKSLGHVLAMLDSIQCKNSPKTEIT